VEGGSPPGKAPSGVSKVEFYSDGSQVGEDATSPYEYSWDTTKVSDGEHTVLVKAYDNVGTIGVDCQYF